MRSVCKTFFTLWMLLGALPLSQAQTENPCKPLLDSASAYSHSFDASQQLRHFAILLQQCAADNQQDSTELEALSMIGASYFREGDYNNARLYFEKTRKMALNMGDSAALALTHINLGNTMIGMDSIPKAMQYMTNAARILESIPDSSNLSFVYNSMAHIMGKVKNVERQLHYSSRAYSYSGMDMSDRSTLRLAVNYAINLSNNGMLDSSEALSLKVLVASREIGYIKSLTQVLNHLANLSLKKNDSEYALNYAKECLTYETKLNHPITFNTAYTHLGMAYFYLDSISESIVALQRAQQFGEVENNLVARQKPLNYLHQAYARAKRWNEAYEALEQYKRISDTLSSEQNIRILNDIETKYQTEKKEQQLRDLAQQNQISELKVKQRNIWIIVLLVLGFLIAITIFFVSRQRLLKQQQETLENRLLSLRVQLNPHFIFNALTAVQNYMLGGKDLREAVRYLSNFAKVMRAFLEYNQEEQITLDKELNALELYVGIQKLRFSNGFEFEVEIDDALNPEEVQVPPMILQPLIENAIEHGIRNMDNGKITLKYELEGDCLIMKLTDNGIGRKRAATESPKVVEKTSLATRITEERIALLNRKGQGSYSLVIQDANEDGTGTEVVFKIPFSEV